MVRRSVVSLLPWLSSFGDVGRYSFRNEARIYVQHVRSGVGGGSGRGLNRLRVRACQGHSGTTNVMLRSCCALERSEATPQVRSRSHHKSRVASKHALRPRALAWECHRQGRRSRLIEVAC